MHLANRSSKRWLIYLYLLYVVGLHSCKSFERIFVGSASDVLNESELIDLLIEKQLDYDQIFYKRAFVEIDQDGKNQAVRANIYVKRDSAIIISVIPILGIELYRIMLDQRGVFLIDRVNRTIAEADYASISNRIMVNFNYNQIQSILTNRVFTYPIDNLQTLKRFSGVKNENKYTLTSSGSGRLGNEESLQVIDILPDLFRINSSFISYPSKSISMNISYLDFISLPDNVPFPSKIVIQGVKDQESIVLTLTFSSVDIDGNQSLSFSMPSNYAKIKF